MGADSAHVPRAVCGVQPEQSIDIEAVRHGEVVRGVHPELASLRDLHASDGEAAAENAKAVVARRTGRHGERRVIRTRDRMSVVDRAKIDTPRAADGRIARKHNLADRGIDDVLCEGRRERALAVRPCALDDELLDARHLRARTVLRRRRVVVVEVELCAVLHGDRAAGRTGRTLHRVVAEFHRAGLDLDVRRVGENARAERERAAPLLEELPGVDRARSRQRVVRRGIDRDLRRSHGLGHLHGGDGRRFVSVEPRHPRRIERHGRSRAVPEPRGGGPHVTGGLRTPHALVQLQRIAHAARRAHVLAVHARVAEVPGLSGGQARRRRRHRAGLRHYADVRGAGNRRERGVGGPLERQVRAGRPLAEVAHVGRHVHLAAAGRRDLIDQHERRIRRRVGSRPDFDLRHFVGGHGHRIDHVLVCSADVRPVNGSKRLVRKVSEAKFVIGGVRPASKHEERLRGIARIGRKAEHLHHAVAGRVAAGSIVPVVPPRVRGSAGNAAAG